MSHTTVIVNQPQPTGHAVGSPLLVTPVYGQRDWSSGLCGCLGDCGSVVYVWFCPACALSSMATRTGECFCMPFCVPASLLAMRARLRTLGGIHGSICNDCVAIWCCGLCVMCQMLRELQRMGL